MIQVVRERKELKTPHRLLAREAWEAANLLSVREN